MVEYNCFRCGYSTTHKGSLINHLKRKNICKPTLVDISIEEIKNYYNFDTSTILHQNPPKLHQNPPNIPPKYSTKIHQNPPKFENSSTKIHQNPPKLPVINECPYCYKRFSRSDSLNRHYGRCKIKKENENEKDKKIEELIKNQEEMKEQMKEMVEKLLTETKGNTNISNNTNNSHNTTNNIININNYGDENTKYITSDYILKLLKNKPAKAIPELIKYTHFNDKHPENQNIKITNKKEPYIKVLKNDKWELQDKDETITDLIDRQQVHLLDETIEEKIEKKCNNSEKINIERCNDLYNEEDKEYMKRLYNESELIIINNS